MSPEEETLKEEGISGTCATCDDAIEYGSGPSITPCPGCKHLICEVCEVQRCPEGRHDCPLCGAMIAECRDRP
jgi:hypothetical protein